MDVRRLHGRDVLTESKEASFAIVPLGSLEYHGPHSPLGTDLYLAEGFATRIAPELKPLLFPAIPYAACPGKTQDYPGTIAIRPEIYHAYLGDVLRGICKMGVRKILLLNAHDGNMGVSRTIAEQITSEWKDASFLLLNWWQMVTQEESANWGIFEGTNGRGHGGPYELSAVKAMHPDLVEVREADTEYLTPPPFSSLPYILVEGKPRAWDGYTGLIRQISQASGEKIVSQASINLNALLKNWLQPSEQQSR